MVWFVPLSPPCYPPWPQHLLGSTQEQHYLPGATELPEPHMQLRQKTQDLVQRPGSTNAFPGSGAARSFARLVDVVVDVLSRRQLLHRGMRFLMGHLSRCRREVFIALDKGQDIRQWKKADTPHQAKEHLHCSSLRYLSPASWDLFCHWKAIFQQWELSFHPRCSENALHHEETPITRGNCSHYQIRSTGSNPEYRTMIWTNHLVGCPKSGLHDLVLIFYKNNYLPKMSNTI